MAVVTIVVVVDFDRFGFAATANRIPNDIAVNMNNASWAKVSPEIPGDNLSDFLRKRHPRMKKKIVKVTAGPTMSPTLFKPDAGTWEPLGRD